MSDWVTIWSGVALALPCEEFYCLCNVSQLSLINYLKLAGFNPTLEKYGVNKLFVYELFSAKKLGLRCLIKISFQKI